MPRVDYLPPEFGIPLALVLWVIVIFMLYHRQIRNKIDDFFAQRRHNRRERERKLQTIARNQAISKALMNGTYTREEIRAALGYSRSRETS